MSAEARHALELAERRWEAALQRHWMAPPDPGFADRLRELADATEQQAAAFQIADRAGLTWRPLPGARELKPPFELRPGTNRLLPEERWAPFDSAFERLGVALEGVSVTAIARAWGEISAAARALATDVAEREVQNARARRAP
jgi:hypothetical protein